MNKILQGDCVEMMKTLEENSIDLICTDPPYGIGFMGKEWDTFKPDSLKKSVEKAKRKDSSLGHPRHKGELAGASPAMESARYDHTNQGAKKFREWFTDISTEMLRVLKPGAFAFVCIGARQDSVSAVITAMTEAGFKTDFTSLFWTYASGFPKAMNISKAVDKRLGKKRERNFNPNPTGGSENGVFAGRYSQEAISQEAISQEAKTLQGSYGGFQPKPAVEVIVVAMKPLSEKGYLDQALKNGKGITWLDDCRIGIEHRTSASASAIFGTAMRKGPESQVIGRFPANLLVSDDVLKENSRFFSLDEWAEQLPLLWVSKAAKSEKNHGVDKEPQKTNDGRETESDNAFQRGSTLRKNHHPTVKPIKLMSYLITLGSRGGDTVLDPFAGSGTTLIAAKKLGRNYLGIEKEEEYIEIANARINAIPATLPI